MTTILRGNIIHAPALGQLETAPRGYLVVEDGTYLCFVEVKLRKNAAYGPAAAFVDCRKQDKLRTAATLYLSRRPTDLQPRFDVIEVYAPQGVETEKPELFHLENAF